MAPPNPCGLIPRKIPTDQVTELKWDFFYGGLPKWYKVMVSYLKETNKEKTCSDYLWAAWQAENEEAMEISWSLAMANASKLGATSFFPLWKLKGSQLARTPSMWMVHLEEKSTDEEEGINGEDPDDIEGMAEEFIVCLARAVKDAQQMEKLCYHCDSPDHFIYDCPQLAETKADVSLNWKERMVPRKGGWAPQGKMAMLRMPQDGMPKAYNPKHRLPSWILTPLTNGTGSKM